MLNTEFLPFSIADRDFKKSFEFDGVTYKLRLRKNEINEFYTLDVFSEDDEVVYTSILNYSRYYVNSIFPDLPFQISPFDVLKLYESSEAVTEITDETLGDPVQLYTGLEIV